MAELYFVIFNMETAKFGEKSFFMEMFCLGTRPLSQTGAPNGCGRNFIQVKKGGPGGRFDAARPYGIPM
jgi:hypothetical protein